MKDGLITELSNTLYSGQVGYYMKVTCTYREIYFSWGLLALMILLKAKLFSAEAEIKNKRQKLCQKKKKQTTPIVEVQPKEFDGEIRIHIHFQSSQ